MTRQAWVAFAVVTIFSVAAFAADDGTRLLRFPDIHGDTVVFCYGGDLWSASADGGSATRLTAHPGQEVFPRFSPDGQWIAFTGQYDGDEQVYVIPATGGEPKRLTWYPAEGPLPPRWGYDHQVFGWTPDGSAVLFRSLRDAGGGSEGRLYTVSVDGGLPRRCPCPPPAPATSRPMAARWSTRRCSATSATGSATRAAGRRISTSSIWRPPRSPPSPTATRTERDPMWIGDAIYFVSDRDDRLNLFKADPTTGEVEQLTAHDPWDSAGRPPTTEPHRLRAQRPAPDLRRRHRRRHTPSPSTSPMTVCGNAPAGSRWPATSSDFGLSPKGERALFVARGEVFSAPIEKGRTRNLTRSSGAHDRVAAWSPDGAQIAYISDAERRGRDLARRPERHRARAAAHRRSLGPALRSRLVARRRPDRLHRLSRPSLGGDGGRRRRGSGGGRHPRRHRRLRVVARTAATSASASTTRPACRGSTSGASPTASSAR